LMSPAINAAATAQSSMSSRDSLHTVSRLIRP
jgi:hypothetical protein